MIKRNELKEFDIKTKEDVRDFAKYVIEELGCNYHPDDGFGDMVDIETGEDVFDEEAYRYLNAINDKCFEVVADDVYYDICAEVIENFIL